MRILTVLQLCLLLLLMQISALPLRTSIPDHTRHLPISIVDDMPAVTSHGPVPSTQDDDLSQAKQARKLVHLLPFPFPSKPQDEMLNTTTAHNKRFPAIVHEPDTNNTLYSPPSNTTLVDSKASLGPLVNFGLMGSSNPSPKLTKGGIIGLLIGNVIIVMLALSSCMSRCYSKWKRERREREGSGEVNESYVRTPEAPR